MKYLTLVDTLIKFSKDKLHNLNSSGNIALFRGVNATSSIEAKDIVFRSRVAYLIHSWLQMDQNRRN